MTAREVIELIKKNLGVPFNDRTYRDTFKIGDPDATVTGIATARPFSRPCSKSS